MKPRSVNNDPGSIKRIEEIEFSQDPRAPKADITNAPLLFGDPDFDDGDVDYGEVDYGEVDTLSPFELISGEPDFEMGAPSGRRNRGLKYAAGAAVIGTGAFLAHKAIKASRERKLMQRKLDSVRVNQSLRSANRMRSEMGALSKDTMYPFFQLTGAKMNSSPIAPSSAFVTDMWKNMLDRQAMDTPFLQETAIGTFLAGVWTVTTVGVPTNRFFTGLMLQFGTNMLNAAPATIINITATIPTIAGPLVIAAQPFIFTYEKGFDVRFLVFPWNLVSNKPLPVLGQYSAAVPITFVVTGLPAASSVNLVVPGSLHPWIVAMRNSLMK